MLPLNRGLNKHCMTTDEISRLLLTETHTPVQPAWQAQKAEGGREKSAKVKRKGVPVLRASVFFVLPNNFPNSSNDVNCQYATDHK